MGLRGHRVRLPTLVSARRSTVPRELGEWRGDEVGRQPLFEHVGGASRLQCRAYIVRIIVNGQKHKLRATTGTRQSSCCFDAIQAGHGDIKHYDIGIELRCCLDQVQAVGNRTNYFELTGEYIANLRPDFGMIIRQQSTREFGPGISGFPSATRCAARCDAFDARPRRRSQLRDCDTCLREPARRQTSRAGLCVSVSARASVAIGTGARFQDVHQSQHRS